MGMNKQIYPTKMTNTQWNCIKELVPAAKPGGGRPRILDMRMVINAIFYITVGGIQWRLLPKEYTTGKAAIITSTNSEMMVPGSVFTTPYDPELARQ